MAGPTATCYGREGTKAFFYSRHKSWDMEIHGLDPTNVVARYKYELDFSSKPGRIVKRMDLNSYYDKDMAEKGLTTVGEALSAQPPLPQSHPYSAPSGGSEGLPAKDLAIIGTACVKSMLEMGKTLPEAMSAGVVWANLWGDLPTKAQNWFDGAREPVQVTPDETKELDDDIPF